MFRFAVCALLAVSTVTAWGQDHIWTDKSQNFSFSAKLLGYTADHVLLQRANKQILTVPIDQLSDDDRKYLASKEAAEVTQRRADQKQTWTLANGLKVVGRVVDFIDKDLSVQNKRGRVYVDDRPFNKLPPVQQRILLQLVGQQENKKFDDENALQSFLDNQPRQYTLEGVVFEHEDGEEFGVPFFFFNDQDRSTLQAGWERWQAANAKAEQDKEGNDAKAAQTAKDYESLKLQGTAEDYQSNPEQSDRDIKMLELSLLATAAGVTDMWEVQIFPNAGVADYPRTVIVPGRNSAAAQQAVAAQYPNYTIGAALKLNANGAGRGRFRW